MQKKETTWRADLLLAEEILAALGGHDLVSANDVLVDDIVVAIKKNDYGPKSPLFPFMLNIVKRKFEITTRDNWSKKTRNIFVPSNPLQVLLGFLIGALYQPDTSVVLSPQYAQVPVRSILGFSLFGGGMSLIFSHARKAASEGRQLLFVFSDNIFWFRPEVRDGKNRLIYRSIDGEKMEGSITKSDVRRELCRALKANLKVDATYLVDSDTMVVNSGENFGPGWAQFATFAPDMMVDAPALISKNVILSTPGMGSGTFGTSQMNNVKSCDAATHLATYTGEVVSEGCRSLPPVYPNAHPVSGGGVLIPEISDALLKLSGVKLTVEREMDITDVFKPENYGKVLDTDFLGMSAAVVPYHYYDDRSDEWKTIPILTPALQYDRLVAALAYSRKGLVGEDDEKPTKPANNKTNAYTFIQQEMLRIAKSRSLFLLGQLYPEVLAVEAVNINVAMDESWKTLKKILGTTDDEQALLAAQSVAPDKGEMLDRLASELAEQLNIVDQVVQSGGEGVSSKDILEFGYSGGVPDTFSCLQILLGEDIAIDELEYRLFKVAGSDFTDWSELRGFVNGSYGTLADNLVYSTIDQMAEDGFFDAGEAIQLKKDLEGMKVPQHYFEKLMVGLKMGKITLQEANKTKRPFQAKRILGKSERFVSRNPTKQQLKLAKEASKAVSEAITSTNVYAQVNRVKNEANEERAPDTGMDAVQAVGELSRLRTPVEVLADFMAKPADPSSEIDWQKEVLVHAINKAVKHSHLTVRFRQAVVANLIKGFVFINRGSDLLSSLGIPVGGSATLKWTKTKGIVAVP
jgi:hypothetical protein